ECKHDTEESPAAVAKEAVRNENDAACTAERQRPEASQFSNTCFQHSGAGPESDVDWRRLDGAMLRSECSRRPPRIVYRKGLGHRPGPTAVAETRAGQSVSAARISSVATVIDAPQRRLWGANVMTTSDEPPPAIGTARRMESAR